MTWISYSYSTIGILPVKSRMRVALKSFAEKRCVAEQSVCSLCGSSTGEDPSKMDVKKLFPFEPGEEMALGKPYCSLSVHKGGI